MSNATFFSYTILHTCNNLMISTPKNVKNLKDWLKNLFWGRGMICVVVSLSVVEFPALCNITVLAKLATVLIAITFFKGENCSLE